MKNRIWLLLLSLFAFACGGVDDLTNDDFYPLQVTRAIDENGVEHVETKRLPFDEGLYGQTQEALSDRNIAPPNRYGISSAASASANDTRCPSGGFASTSSNYCEMLGGKHINWTIRFLDHHADTRFGIDIPHYVSLGILQLCGDSSNTGFVCELDNPQRTTDGKINWGTCNSGFMCESSNVGPVVLYGGKRVRLDTPASYFIRLDEEKLFTDIGGMNNSQKAFTVMNFTAHEAGHAEGFGHVPVSETNLDVMNLENSNTSQIQKHLSAAEKSQLTSWMAN